MTKRFLTFALMVAFNCLWGMTVGAILDPHNFSTWVIVIAGAVVIALKIAPSIAEALEIK